MSTLPCMRPDDIWFEHETPIVLENPDGTEDRYECRIEFSVAFDDAVTVRQVDVLYGGPEFGRWQDCRRTEERSVHEALYEKANDMADLLFDTVAVEVEDRRAEQEKEAWLNARELEIDNADNRGHALRERMAERMNR